MHAVKTLVITGHWFEILIIFRIVECVHKEKLKKTQIFTQGTSVQSFSQIPSFFKSP